MMQYSELDECIDLMKIPDDSLSARHPLLSPISGSTRKILDYYIELFVNELECNIQNKNTPEQKVDLIKLYVSRLMRTQNHTTIKNIQPDSDPNIPEIDKNKIGTILTRVGGLLIADNSYNRENDIRLKKGVNVLYYLLFDELQKCCSIYEIPFIEICTKLGFPLDTIRVQVPTQVNNDFEKQPIDLQQGVCEKLGQALFEYGFYNLSLVKELNEQSRAKLIQLICSHEVPYKIAMFDFLGFINYFLKEYDSRRTIMYKRFGEIFCARFRPVSSRTIQGNINDLNKKPENRDPDYTASNYKDEVKKHYEMLK